MFLGRLLLFGSGIACRLAQAGHGAIEGQQWARQQLAADVGLGVFV